MKALLSLGFFLYIFVGLSAHSEPQKVPGSFGSSLTLKKILGPDEFELFAITDRGPNLKGMKSEECDERVFPEPQFSPQFATISWRGEHVSIVKSSLLYDRSGRAFSGQDRSECAVDINGQRLKSSAEGIDPEAIEMLDAQSFLVGEESIPALIRFSIDGRETERYLPGEGLPKLFAFRRINRGIEAIAKIGEDKVISFLQSPINKEVLCGNSLVVPFAISRINSRSYQLGLVGFDGAEDIKIGDAAFLQGDTVLMLVGREIGKSITWRVEKISVSNFIPIVDDEKTKEMLIAGPCHITQIQRTALFSDLPNFQFDKVEGLALIDRRGFVVINDDDFGITPDDEKRYKSCRKSHVPTCPVTRNGAGTVIQLFPFPKAHS